MHYSGLIWAVNTAYDSITYAYKALSERAKGAYPYFVGNSMLVLASGGTIPFYSMTSWKREAVDKEGRNRGDNMPSGKRVPQNTRPVGSRGSDGQYKKK